MDAGGRGHPLRGRSTVTGELSAPSAGDPLQEAPALGKGPTMPIDRASHALLLRNGEGYGSRGELWPMEPVPGAEEKLPGRGQGASGEQEYMASTAPKAIFISHILGDSFWPVVEGYNRWTSPQITVRGGGSSERTQLWAPDPQRSWGRPTTLPPSRDGGTWGGREPVAPWQCGSQQRPPSWTTRPYLPTAAWHPGSCFEGPSDRNPCPWGEQGSLSSSGVIATFWQAPHLGYRLTYSLCHHPYPL